MRIFEATNVLHVIAQLIFSIAVAGIAHAGQPPVGMVEIPEGIYEPLYKSSDADRSEVLDETEIVERYYLDEKAVTNAQYLQFVKQNPKWQRSRVPGLFADSSYLAHWASDLDYGDQQMADLPVVSVSWFSAVAYCRWKGKILPTVAQWERAASASETQEYAKNDPQFAQRILEWYSSPADQPLIERISKTDGYKNIFGAWNLHGMIWEWTRDFNTAMVTGESRGDSGLERQLFCGSGSVGAADARDYASFMRFAFRSSLGGDYTVGSLGFRCSMNP